MVRSPGPTFCWWKGGKKTCTLPLLSHTFHLYFLWIRSQTILGSSSWAQGWPFPQRQHVGGLLLESSVPQTGCKALPALISSRPGHLALWLFGVQKSDTGCFLRWLPLEWPNLKGDAEPGKGMMGRCEITLLKSPPQQGRGSSCFLGGNDWSLRCGRLVTAQAGGCCSTLPLRFVHFLLLSQPPSESEPSSSHLDSGRGPRLVFCLWAILQSRPLRNVSWNLKY